MRTVKSVLIVTRMGYVGGESSLPSELWLTPKEPLESILKASMSLILSLN